MKRNLVLILTIFLTACGTNSSDKKEQKVKIKEFGTKKSRDLTDKGKIEETEDLEYDTFYVVVADTNSNYYLLHKKMFDLNRQLNIPIDTMGRFYNKTKNLIALPDNDQDEMYAGDYFPRRFPSGDLSLEYLDVYQKDSGDKTIALVAGIYETEKSADSVVTAMKAIEKKAFKIKADIYVGCMH